MGYYLSTQRSRWFGVHNLEIQNKCLLSKWLYKLINKNGVWQDLLKRKYLYNKSITQVDRK